MKLIEHLAQMHVEAKWSRGAGTHVFAREDYEDGNRRGIDLCIESFDLRSENDERVVYRLQALRKKLEQEK